MMMWINDVAGASMFAALIVLAFAIAQVDEQMLAARVAHARARYVDKYVPEYNKW